MKQQLFRICMIIFLSCPTIYAQSTNPTSPVTLEDLSLLKQTLLWTEEDDAYLQMAGEVLAPQLDDILDVWYGYVGSHPHLLYYFHSNGEPDPRYLSEVRQRFKQWVLDLCLNPYDQDWLNDQHEIGLRHTSKKGHTDQISDTPTLVNYRYMIAFIYPITVTIKPFLSQGNHSPEQVENMYNAWFKAVVLSDILWTHSYVNSGQF